ncbi:MAG: membrane protein insertase YidC [Oscillospiraceae bacterium]|nr:membrane protein insertase YidC [Oscillospiraceae bacterium]
MELINTIIGTPLGWLMYGCYWLFRNYGIAILAFTLLTKVVMFPISLLVQKNSIKMVKMKPQLDMLRYQYVDDSDAFIDAQSALYKKEHYNPMAGVIPLLLQLPIILGLLDVVYKPLKHILHLSPELQRAFVEQTARLMSVTVDELGSTAQLSVVERVRAMPDAFASIPGSAEAVAQIQNLRMTFFGINLAETPSVHTLDALFLIPMLAGLSALVMCWVQNKVNVLQIEQNKLSQWGMTAFMIAFSTFFAFIVPAGVGLYWTFGNLFSIGVMFLCNAVYSPKAYIDYALLEEMKRTAAQDRERKKQNAVLAKKYYKEFFSKENKGNMKIMFYSEGSGFYKYFRALIEALLRDTNLTIHYVTSDPEDAIFQKNEPRIRPYYVDETRLISLMMKLESDMVVMTTPDLEKYHIKRSRVKENVEYVFMDHGCSSDNLAYRTGALDAYDTLLVVSREQAIEARAIEKLRRVKKKRIIECGYGLIDDMIAAYTAMDKVENEKKTILIAPSWQYDNIMDSCLDDLVDALYGRGYRIVIRPHPQYVRRFPTRMKEIIQRYQDRAGDDFVIETDFSSNVTVYTADLVITDWSGIAFEFSFTTDKPSLFINTQMKVVNEDWQKIPLIPFDITARSKVGRQVEKDEVKELAPIVEELLAHQEDYKERIAALKQQHFYNLGHSGEVGAQYIVHRLERRYPGQIASHNPPGGGIGR